MCCWRKQLESVSSKGILVKPETFQYTVSVYQEIRFIWPLEKFSSLMKVTGRSRCYQYNNRASMCQRQSDKLVIRVVFCDRVIMVLSVTDLLTVSVTINWCVFSFNLVPKIRNLIVRKPCFRRFKRLRKICRWYEQTPLILSRM